MKLPSSFKASSDSPNRLIFTCGNRGNHVFDLEMFEDKLRIYTKEQIERGDAIGLQKRPFVLSLDLVETNLMSFCTHDKEVKWRKTTKLDSIKPSDLQDRFEATENLPEVIKLSLNQSENYMLAVNQQSISIVNKLTGGEY